LYKFYLEEGSEVQAIKSMKIVFKSNKFDKESKHRVLSDFISFVNTKPQYEKDLEELVTFFSKEGNGKVYEKLGAYYVAKNQKERALQFYEKGVQAEDDNYSLLKSTILLQINLNRFDEAAGLSEEALEIFPAQALLYLLNGVSNNGLLRADEAIESLETGIDYLLDDMTMERDFYTQLSKAYTLKGDPIKATMYAKKASEIIIPNE